jgi:hypothetical protein
MTWRLTGMAIIPAGFAAGAAGLFPLLTVIAVGVLALIAAILFVPSREPVRRLTELLTAARSPGNRQTPNAISGPSNRRERARRPPRHGGNNEER